MFSKKIIVEYLQKNKTSSFKNLARILNVASSQNKQFSTFLNTLKNEGQIAFSKKHDCFFIPEFIGSFETEYKTNIKGNAFCFVKDSNSEKELRAIIFKHNDLNPLKNDLVLVDFYKDLDEGFYFAILKEIKKRKNEYLLAEVDENLDIKPLFFNQDFEFQYDKKSLEANTYVKFKIEKINRNSISLRLVKKLFSTNQPYADIDLIIEHANVDDFFSNEVIEESKLIPDEVENIHDFNRVDLTNQLIVTIDGEKTKDFDDAISVKKKDENIYVLGVHIADVAYYVKEDSQLDKEALRRGTSIYLIDKVIPMLPEKLSNGICSLNPNVNRFTLSLEVEIDKDGNILNKKIFPSLICSKYRLTYNQVANMENDPIIKNDSNLFNMLKNAYELSDILSKKKNEEGYIDFEIEEPIIELDPKTGKTIAIKNRVRLSSEILIENFMVLANEVVSKTIADLQIPSIYRIHEAPDQEKIDNLKTFIKLLGINAKIKITKDPKDFQKTILDIKKYRFDNLIKMFLLRTMQKAKYSSDNIGHFGLASKYYSHFTSPIRRYPDLLLHRIIWEVLIKNNKNYSIKNKDKIQMIAKQSFDSEVKAVDLERRVNDVKKAEFYENKIN
ncbi:MAG: VacB/RNase II family 3'-5' exoribonuclease, partial [Mycoplasmataceae bacterium]|nr:VacB/RNase II family 3'-5' exoribonuclease [Mycoplasmataceae bacterium]